jgi:hypothetical protein
MDYEGRNLILITSKSRSDAHSDACGSRLAAKAYISKRLKSAKWAREEDVLYCMYVGKALAAGVCQRQGTTAWPD